METKKFNFTKHTIENLPAPQTGKRSYYGDTKVSGLLVDVTSNGRKTFYFRRKVNRISQRILIRPFPEFTIEEARNKALEIASLIAKEKAHMMRGKQRKQS